MTVCTSALPASLPDTGAITAAAQVIASRAAAANEYVDDAHGELSGVGCFFATPDTPKVTAAMADVVKPLAADLETSVGPVKTGLDGFASDIEHLRARYVRLCDDVAEHNHRPRPSMEDPLRHAYDREESVLRAEVRSVRRLYDEAVERCEDRIRSATPSDVPGFPVSPGAMFAVGAALTSRQAWYEANGRFIRVRNGRINLHVAQPIPRHGRTISGLMMRRVGIPTSYVEKYLQTFDPQAGHRVSIGDWRRAVRNVDSRSALGLMFAARPWLRRRFLEAHVHVTPARARGAAKRPVGNARIIAQDPKGVDLNAHGKDRNQTLKHPDSAQWSKAAKTAAWGGRGLGVLGFTGAAMDGYNHSVERNPEASPRVHVTNAVVDATVEATASAVGAKVGGMVGRTAGAVIGQALIPIPGVGAAVGAVAGGLLGNVAGGWIGNKVGKGSNAAKHGEGESLGDKAQDFIGGLFS